MPPVTIILVVAALTFGYLNGFHDSSNVVATVISSRAMPPYFAMGLAGLGVFCGPFLFGVAVAETIGRDIAPPDAITPAVILSALLAAIAWNLITWWFGVPSSSSHALIGGLVGAVAGRDGFGLIQTAGLTKVLVALVVSPIAGAGLGWLMMKAIIVIARLLDLSPRINWAFKRGQTLTAATLALSHGTNDAQKTMGMIMMALISTGYMNTFQVPMWVVASSAGAMAFGMTTGGWRIIRTVGHGIYRVRLVHGFSAQATAAAVILGAALLGGPVSTTQVVSSAIMGVGSAERMGKVRWGVVENILLAWIITVPVTALLAAALVQLISQSMR
jgi:PiT family inorganic phosphate transporter